MNVTRGWGALERLLSKWRFARVRSLLAGIDSHQNMKEQSTLDERQMPSLF